MKKRDISGMAVNKERCKSCPFNDHGSLELRTMIQKRSLTGSQLCHETENKTLCRGARDFQLQILHRMDFLKEPTDKCWQKTWEELKKRKV